MCCESPGRNCSESNSVVFLRRIHNDIVGIQRYFCERAPDLKNYSLCEIVNEGIAFFWIHIYNKLGQIEDPS